MGWYPGIIGSTTPGGGDLLGAVMAGEQASVQHRVGFDFTNANFPTTANRITQRMFYQNYNIEYINLPTIERIESIAFYNNKFLKGIEFTSCTFIGNEAFHGCGGNFEQYTRPSIYKINLPAVKTLGDSAIREMAPTITSLYPATVCEINLDSCEKVGPNCFRGTGNNHFYVPRLNLPSATEIGSWALALNEYEIVTIGSNCSKMNNPFFDATIDTLIVNRSTPPEITGTLMGNIGTVGTIYVPSGAVSTYQAATGWSDYSSIISAIPTNLE